MTTSTATMAWERTGPALFGMEQAPTRVDVTSPELAAEAFGDLLYDLDREACVMLHLDTRHRLLGREVLSLGSIDHTFMAPREILRRALLANANAIVLAHNHPSGDPEPSQDDLAVTTRIDKACDLVGITLLDHLVYGNGRWTSLARRGAC
jgi:DNA repair protein RadC